MGGWRGASLAGPGVSLSKERVGFWGDGSVGTELATQAGGPKLGSPSPCKKLSVACALVTPRGKQIPGSSQASQCGLLGKFQAGWETLYLETRWRAREQHPELTSVFTYSRVHVSLLRMGALVPISKCCHLTLLPSRGKAWLSTSFCLPGGIDAFTPHI